ncbi:MAG: AMP-binding protein [Desulfobacteraceae bacterium]|nr:AMP-binding protein [Desulfobacteraceae bacterium]
MNNFIHSFTHAAEKYADKTALVWYASGQPGAELTYAGLNRAACRMARTLAGRGIVGSDRVILCMDKSLFWVTAHLAILMNGAVSVPLNPGFRRDEMAYFIADSEPALVIAGPGQARLIRDIVPVEKILEVDTRQAYTEMDIVHAGSNDLTQVDTVPDDPALIIYTSGTTGRPKGAVLSGENLYHDCENINSMWRITHTDVLCHSLPLFHVHGLCFALHTCLTAGARVLLLDAFVPGQVLRRLSALHNEEKVSIFMAVPTMYRKLVDQSGYSPSDFRHLRLLTSGSAPLLEKDFRKITSFFGKPPVEREGMSETGMNFSNPLDGTRKPGSIGLPLPGVTVRVVDPKTFAGTAPGETGEFWLKGPAITGGYWRKPVETEKAFEKGWFRTGDLGRVDQDGYYYLTDRIKNIIISGGENISPREIELVINRLAGVIESAVIGIADPAWGEKVVAAVVVRPEAGVTIESIRNWCKARLHPWKCPKQFLMVDALPKNTMGKVLKNEVEKLFITT